MTQSTVSKITSIEEQIKKLQDKKKREIAKLEKNTGKRFIEKFNLENKSIEEIYSFIETLEELTRDTITIENSTGTSNDESNQ
ncbi:hypothetical protein M3175_20615 [Robertmurraya korlensis]|uniref:hypothetical protein n=1 Tax=Robertmurraya korlensis TaxID=519977 RepID=UPI00203D3F36|nr:hypothetical protein [Robertmurraya korlensis]MCM3603146.1 hypothetical protein [Robertmurraya korlensis]